jgi:hypothetical protein
MSINQFPSTSFTTLAKGCSPGFSGEDPARHAGRSSAFGGRIQ